MLRPSVGLVKTKTTRCCGRVRGPIARCGVLAIPRSRPDRPRSGRGRPRRAWGCAPGRVGLSTGRAPGRKRTGGRFLGHRPDFAQAVIYPRGGCSARIWGLVTFPRGRPRSDLADCGARPRDGVTIARREGIWQAGRARRRFLDPAGSLASGPANESAVTVSIR
jgi:hypothetical protein